MVDTTGATIIELPNQQAVVRDPEPRFIEVTRAAIDEGYAWLEVFGGEGELTEEGAQRAEVLRTLLTAADFYGGIAIGALTKLQVVGREATTTLQSIA